MGYNQDDMVCTGCGKTLKADKRVKVRHVNQLGYQQAMLYKCKCGTEIITAFSSERGVHAEPQIEVNYTLEGSKF